MFKSKLFQDSFYVFFTDALGYLTKIMWGILLARWLGPEYLGIFYFYTGIFAIIASLGEFGKIAHLMRELNASDNPIQEFKFYFNLHYSTSILLVLFSCLFVLFNEVKIDFLIIAFSSVLLSYFDSFTNVLTTWYFSKGKASFVSNIGILRSVLTLVTGYLLFLIEVPNYLLLCVPAVFTILRFQFFFLNLNNECKLNLPKFVWGNFSKVNLKKAFKDTWVFGSLSILATIYGQSDPVLLKYLGFTAHDFGVIGAASKMKGVLMMGGGAILNVIFPRLTKDSVESKEKFGDTFYKIFNPLLTLNILLCVFLIIFSGDIIRLLFGIEFLDSIPFMFYFSIGSLVPVSVFLSSCVIAVGKQKLILINSVIINLSYPLLKILLIPIFGPISIGWIEAVLPFIVICNFFYFLKEFLVPNFNYIYLIRVATLILIGVGSAVLSFVTSINQFISLLVISIILLFSSYSLGFLDYRILLKKNSS